MFVNKSLKAQHHPLKLLLMCEVHVCLFIFVVSTTNSIILPYAISIFIQLATIQLNYMHAGIFQHGNKAK